LLLVFNPRNDTVGQKGFGETFLTRQAMRLGEDKATKIAKSQAVVGIGKRKPTDFRNRYDEQEKLCQMNG
jgi:hypothetical protein